MNLSKYGVSESVFFHIYNTLNFKAGYSVLRFSFMLKLGHVMSPRCFCLNYSSHLFHIQALGLFNQYSDILPYSMGNQANYDV